MTDLTFAFGRYPSTSISFPSISPIRSPVSRDQNSICPSSVPAASCVPLGWSAREVTRKYVRYSSTSSTVPISHISMSSPPTINCPPSGEKRSVYFPERECSRRNVKAFTFFSHKRTTPRQSIEAICLPSGLYAKSLTRRLPPVSVSTTCPVVVSNRCNRSPSAISISVPSGLNSSASTFISMVRLSW